MSGHSHWAGIKHKKGLADAKRSQVFSKLAKELTVAAKEGGADPESNPRLRTVVERAKTANMPADNVERAIKKGSGTDEGQLHEMLIEAYGPEGIALLITAITDNKNRTLGEIKQLLSRNQGKMVEGGAVQWLFERKGVVSVELPELTPDTKESLELAAIEAGADDTYWHENTLDIYTEPALLTSAKEKLEQKGFVANGSLDWVPKEHLSVSPQIQTAAEKLFEALDDQDDVQGIYSNLA